MKVSKLIAKAPTRKGKDILSVGHVPPHDQRDLLLAQLFDSDLQGVGLSLKIHEDRSVHAA